MDHIDDYILYLVEVGLFDLSNSFAQCYGEMFRGGGDIVISVCVEDLTFDV